MIDGNEDDDAYNPSDESEEDLDGEEEGSPQSKPGKKLKQAKTSKAAVRTFISFNVESKKRLGLMALAELS